MWVESEHSPYKKPNVSKEFKRRYAAFRQEWLHRKSQYEIILEESEYNVEVIKTFASYFEGIDELAVKGEFYV